MIKAHVGGSEIFYTYDEAAKWLGITEQDIRILVLEKKLKAVRLDAHIMVIARSEVINHADARVTKVTQ